MALVVPRVTFVSSQIQSDHVYSNPSMAVSCLAELNSKRYLLYLGDGKTQCVVAVRLLVWDVKRSSFKSPQPWKIHWVTLDQSLPLKLTYLPFSLELSMPPPPLQEWSSWTTREGNLENIFLANCQLFILFPSSGLCVAVPRKNSDHPLVEYLSPNNLTALTLDPFHFLESEYSPLERSHSTYLLSLWSYSTLH